MFCSVVLYFGYWCMQSDHLFVDRKEGQQIGYCLVAYCWHGVVTKESRTAGPRLLFSSFCTPQFSWQKVENVIKQILLINVDWLTDMRNHVVSHWVMTLQLANHKKLATLNNSLYCPTVGSDELHCVERSIWYSCTPVETVAPRSKSPINVILFYLFISG